MLVQLFYAAVTLMVLRKSSVYGYKIKSFESESFSFSDSYGPRPSYYGSNDRFELDNLMTGNEEKLHAYFLKLNRNFEETQKKYVRALWKYHTNMTEYNKEKMLIMERRFRLLRLKVKKRLSGTEGVRVKEFTLRRQWQLFTEVGSDILDDYKFDKFRFLIQNMTNHIENVRVGHCYNRSKMLNYKEVLAEMKQTQHIRCLRYYWLRYHDNFDIHSKNQFKQVTDLIREVSSKNGYEDLAKYYFQEFPYCNVHTVTKMLFKRVQRLYWELHAYVRFHLRKFYGSRAVPYRGHLTADLLGDLWGKDWTHLYESTKPFKHVPEFNMTDMMIKQNYTLRTMAKMAENFFSSLYLDSLPSSFWKNSIFEKPKDGRKFDCTPKAWDFYNGEDYRITMCGEVNEETLLKMYYLTGHIQYMMQYKNQHHIFKRAANPAFYEAVALLPSLTVRGLTYQFKMQYLPKEPEHEQLINYLYKLALEHVVFLPYAYALDLFRWKVVNESFTSEEYNVNWWKIRRFLGGIGPPRFRGENTFDYAGIPEGVQQVPYSPYFLGEILAFLLHVELCKQTTHYTRFGIPTQYEFANCDLFGEVMPGRMLKGMMSLGASSSWSYALLLMTKERKFRAYGLTTFFHPLLNFLIHRNRMNREESGWI